jgi:hypothetical protein
MKKIGRRGFIAAAIMGVGATAYAHDKGTTTADYDRTVGVMLANKLLAELEPIAIYEIGKDSPSGFMYQGYDKRCRPVQNCITNLNVDLHFDKFAHNRVEVTAVYKPDCNIAFSSVKIFKRRFHAKKIRTTVTCWNCDGGKIDSFRRHAIKRAFDARIKQKGFVVTQVQPVPEKISENPIV